MLESHFRFASTISPENVEAYRELFFQQLLHHGSDGSETDSTEQNFKKSIIHFGK